MIYRELLEIPDEYDTIEKKLKYLDELSLIEQKRDRMEQDYSFQLYRTKEYWKNELKNYNNISNEEQNGFFAKPVLPAVLICECSSREHQIIIEHDNEDNLTYCHIHLVKHGFWRRLKVGLKYIFGYKCRYGQWEEFILKPEHATQLRELSDLLSRHSR